VPGIEIPEALRARIAAAPDDASAMEIGIEDAQRLVAHVRHSAQGLYLMPPFGSAKIAERVMSALN
jgi:homocysteine S-methyltransferase